MIINKPTILIIGTGQVGHALFCTLQGLGNILVLSSKQLNLLNLEQIENKLIKADIIINASAYTAVDKAQEEIERHKANTINHLAVAKIAMFCKENNIPLIHYSTDYIFDGLKHTYIEDDKPNPINIYGQTKYLGEKAINNINPMHLIFRTSWVYGLRGNNFLLTMLDLSKKHSQLNIINDQFGAPTWSYTIASMTTHIISQALEYKKNHGSFTKWWHQHGGTYNLVANGYTSWYEFAKTIFKAVNIDIQVNPISAINYKTIAKRPMYSILSTDKIQNEFNLSLPTWDIALKYCLSSVNNIS